MNLRFVYKIYSGYDGFTPSDIPNRGRAGRLRLRWRRYIDAVELGQEVWGYFHGPHNFEDGVYLKGRVEDVSRGAGWVILRLRDYSTKRPLTNRRMSRWIARIAAQRGEQVFLLPARGRIRPYCDVWTSAQSCAQRRCTRCPFWRSVPVVSPSTLIAPRRVQAHLDGFVPALWVVPARCYLPLRRVKPTIAETSEIFYRFKLGESALAFPLAVAIRRVLRRWRIGGFDGIVPIPLSPHKKRAGELHRALLLARHLARLLRSRTVQGLKLKKSITKRRFLGQGGTRGQFERAYVRALTPRAGLMPLRHVLLVDDVCTYGSTLSSAAERIRDANPACEVIAATAGVMIRKSVVRRKKDLLRRRRGRRRS